MRREHGPSVVAIGGGHGAAQTLRAARRYAGHVTAVISVADDGGSSGRLREQFGIPAPGDVRRCIGALLEDGSPLREALEYRFSSGELAGHPFGNLLIASLAAASGDFASGVAEAARITGAGGKVFPATIGPVLLKAAGEEGELSGQVEIKQRGGVRRIGIVPPDAEAPPGALAAIRRADQVVLGPGSLFTSVLAALAVEELRRAVGSTRAQVVYVANLREQPPETSGMDVGEHVDALADHGVEPDVVLVDPLGLPFGTIRPGVRAVVSELASPGRADHDPIRLAGALSSLLPRGEDASSPPTPR